MSIYESQKSAIMAWAHNADSKGPLLLCGEEGVGKRKICLEALGVEVVTVSIHENDFFQFQDLLDKSPDSSGFDAANKIGRCHFDSYVSRILNRIGMILEEDAYLFFENMNYCDGEHRRIINQVLAYCDTNKRKCGLILAVNDLPSLAEVHAKQFRSSNCIAFNRLDTETVAKIVKQSIVSKDDAASGIISEKIALLTSGLIGRIPLVLRALERARLLVEVQGGYRLSSGIQIAAFPDNLTGIYDRQLELLPEEERQLLAYALPFGRDIHLNLLSHIMQSRDLNASYSKIAVESTLVVENQHKRPDALFDSSYQLSNLHAKDAVSRAFGGESTNNLASHIRERFFSEHKRGDGQFKSDSYIDQYEMLRYLAGNPHDPSKRVSKEIVADLMGVLFLGGYYARVREVAESYFNGAERRYKYASVHEPLIIDLYLESLYLLGNYERVIAVTNEHSLASARSMLICARAHYAIDDLERSKQWAMRAIDGETAGEAHLLLSSIANWEDNDRASNREFARAMKALESKRGNSQIRPIAKKVQEQHDQYAQLVLRRDYLRYLPKKVKELSEEVESLCQQFLRVESSMSCLSRVQAEILHNHGTDLIKKPITRKKGIEYLKAADRYFEMRCDGDRYCVQNSLGIAACLDENYAIGLERFKQLRPPSHSPFCILAVRNNEIASLLMLENRPEAEKRCRDLLGYIKELAALASVTVDQKTDFDVLRDLARARPDVERQLKHYCLNRARLEADDGLDVAWIEMADELGGAESSSNYLVKKCLYDYRWQNGMGMLKFVTIKPKEPTADSIDSWFAAHEIFLCEVMFWG